LAVFGIVLPERLQPIFTLHIGVVMVSVFVNVTSKFGDSYVHLFCTLIKF